MYIYIYKYIYKYTYIYIYIFIYNVYIFKLIVALPHTCSKKINIDSEKHFYDVSLLASSDKMV